MEGGFGFRFIYVNDDHSMLLQSIISDLEENVKSMLDLINVQNGDSFVERVKMFYLKKPELEQRIAKFEELYRLLSGQCTTLLDRSSCSSISTVMKSLLSDLEENTKSMFSLIDLQNGDSFAKKAEMYYLKKPELEERITKFQQLYLLLIDHYTSLLARFPPIPPPISPVQETNIWKSKELVDFDFEKIISCSEKDKRWKLRNLKIKGSVIKRRPRLSEFLKKERRNEKWSKNKVVAFTRRIWKEKTLSAGCGINYLSRKIR